MRTYFTRGRHDGYCVCRGWERDGEVVVVVVDYGVGDCYGVRSLGRWMWAGFCRRERGERVGASVCVGKRGVI
jgi:hypothetical protein